MKKGFYQTKQRAAILECLRMNAGIHLTIPQIEDKLKISGFQVSRPTVYRWMDTLVSEGIVRKYVLDGNSGTCYQYDCEEEQYTLFHFRCEQCGKLLHFQSKELEHLNELMKHRDGAKIYLDQTVFLGICSHCNEM